MSRGPQFSGRPLPEERPLHRIARVLEQRPRWMERARCVDAPPGTFYPQPANDPVKVAVAKAWCEGCSVRSECLAYALSAERYGVWGGLSELERHALKGLRVRGAKVL